MRHWPGIIIAVVALVTGGCGTASPSGSAAATPAASHSAAANALSSWSPTPVALPPSVDPAESAAIDGRFAVSADGRKLALACWGAGSPTVLLETGGPNIEQWRRSGVVRELSGRMRVCTYDRAGTGGSDPPPNERRDADDVISDLHALLAVAHVDGPYVLLGRSFGGMIVTHFAEQLPAGVLGVVVLDTPAPSATFTAESEPELVWDFPGNTEHLDVVGGFENQFANDPPHLDVPVLVITPVPGEGTAENEAFWLQVSPLARQVQLRCGSEPTDGACATEVVRFVEDLGV